MTVALAQVSPPFRAEAEATRREAQGKHPLVLRLAEQNAALSEELAQTAARLNALAEQAEQTDKLAGRIETQFKRARDTIAIGGLSQELTVTVGERP